MFLTTHAVVAASIFQHFSALPSVLVFLFGFVSHFLLDFIPHGDESLVNNKWSTARKLRRMFFIGLFDLLVVTVFVYWYLANYPINYKVLLGILAAILPDGLQIVHQFLVWQNIPLPSFFYRLQLFHSYVHHFIERRFDFRLTLWQGLLWQAAIIAFFIFVLIL